MTRSCKCFSHNGLRLRSPEGLAQRKVLRSTGLTDRDFFAIFDTVGSVSALVEGEDDFAYDQNHVDLNTIYVPPSLEV